MNTPGKLLGLTDRQSEILELIRSEFLEDKEIAERLKCSRFTVRSHVRAILVKTGAKNRWVAAMMLDRSPSAQGLVDRGNRQDHVVQRKVIAR